MWAELAGAAGSLIGAGLNYDTQQDNIELQKQFAKQGIQWKVADAQKAGVHPLYALGAQTHSFSPIATGDVGSGLAAAGQDIGRAIDASRTPDQKIDAYTASLRALQLEKGGLENEVLRSQLARLNSSPVSAGMASATDPFTMSGQADTARIQDKPLPRVNAMPGMPWAEPGAITGAGWENTPTGIAPVPSKDVKERIEDSPMEWMWFLRNNIIPSVSSEGAALRAPPHSALKRFPGATGWRFNPVLQEYQPVYPSARRRSQPHTREFFGNKF